MTICTIIIAIYVSILILIVEMSKIEWRIASSAWWATTQDQCRLSSTSSSPSMDTFDQVVDGCWCFRYSLSTDESLLTELGLPYWPPFTPISFYCLQGELSQFLLLIMPRPGAAYPVFGLLPPLHFLTWLEWLRKQTQDTGPEHHSFAITMIWMPDKLYHVTLGEVQVWRIFKPSFTFLFTFSKQSLHILKFSI